MLRCASRIYPERACTVASLDVDRLRATKARSRASGKSSSGIVHRTLLSMRFAQLTKGSPSEGDPVRYAQ